MRELEERAEASVGRALVGFVRGQEFHNGVVFVLNAEAGDRLPPVDVEDPQRDAKRPGDPRQEAGERAGGGEVFDDEMTGGIKGFHRRSLYKRLTSVFLLKVLRMLFEVHNSTRLPDVSLV